MADSAQSLDQKLLCFQDATGIQDLALSRQILEAHGWDLDVAIGAMVDMRGSSDTIPASAASPIHRRTSIPLRNGQKIDQKSTAAPPSSGRPESSSQLAALPPQENKPQIGRDGVGSGNSNGSSSPRGQVSLPRDFEPRVASERVSSSHSGPTSSQQGAVLQPREYGPQIGSDRGGRGNSNPSSSSLLWKLVTLPYYVIRGSYNIMYTAVGMGMWITGGMLAYSLGVLGWSEDRDADTGTSMLSLPPGAAEAAAFVRIFEREYGEIHPHFQTTMFMDALRRATTEFKFLFVYLHSPEHVDTTAFCEGTLCSEAVVQFVNENFVSWGADVRSSEGFQMSNSLKASAFPFCALVMGSSNQRIAYLQQVEEFKSASELLEIFQRVIEEQGSVLIAARADQGERELNRHLREEQDAAYRAALQADQEREQRRQEAAECAAKQAAEEERKRKEEELAAAEAAKAAAEREAALERRRQGKALSLGPEPEKGPNATHVVVRFPNGERKERRFHCDATVQCVYDYVDSLGSFDVVRYSLVSNFPRTVYVHEKLSLSLKDAGLHPHASLFVQVEES